MSEADAAAPRNARRALGVVLALLAPATTSSTVGCAVEKELCGTGPCLDATVDASTDAGFEDAGPVPCDGPEGLYVDGSCTEPAPGVHGFQPRHARWADDARVQRHVYLPPDTQIDSSDPDAWIFPEGTRFYETLRVGQTRVETRFMHKEAEGSGPESWLFGSYVWNAAQDAVSLAPPSGVQNVLETGHDIPPASLCLECHAGAADMALGFSAIQLNHDLVGMRLQILNADTVLTDSIDFVEASVPGNATAREALGYLHGNCGHCHGGSEPAAGLDMRLLVGTVGVHQTATFLTAVDQPSGWTDEGITMRIVSGHAFASAVHGRMNRRSFDQMPPFGTKLVDSVGLMQVSQWINALDD